MLTIGPNPGDVALCAKSVSICIRCSFDVHEYTFKDYHYFWGENDWNWLSVGL